MKCVAFFCAILIFSIAESTLKAQGTFIYDQQSAVIADGQAYAGEIPTYLDGQSFTPSLDSVGFVTFEIGDFLALKHGGIIAVNLRSDSISGTILGTSETLSFPATYSPSTPVFIFDTPVSVTPGTTYYFQPYVVSGDVYILGSSDSYNYSGGTAILNGTPSATTDLWFREGIVPVPEPCTGALVACGATLAYFARRKRAKI